MRMRDLAAARPRFGYQRIHLMLRREGRVVNRKKVLRIYREQGLAVRTRRRHKLAARLRVPMPVPLGPREQWSIDFVTDALVEGRRIRVLTVIDNYTRECLALEVAGSLPSPVVTAALDRAISRYGKPNVITCDNGPEFTANLTAPDRIMATRLQRSQTAFEHRRHYPDRVRSPTAVRLRGPQPGQIYVTRSTYKRSTIGEVQNGATF